MISADSAQSLSLVPVDYDPFTGGALSLVVPTTEAQREIWLADQLSQDASLAFNLAVSLRFRGALELEALQGALQTLVNRHEALRASVGPDGETFCIRERFELPLPIHDLSTLDDAARKATMDARLRHSVETPFELGVEPLFRAELLRVAQDEHLLLLTAHHIACDGWSWWLIVRELGALYGQGREATYATLPEPDSFAQYALADAAHQNGAVQAADEAYWLSRFADEVPVLELPTDRTRPLHRSVASARVDHVFDAELLAAVRSLGARRGASLFATLLAGFSGLLSRLSGQSSVVIGIPAAGQPLDGYDNLIGHCVSLLPLRFDIDPAQPFARAIDAAQATLLDALEHQCYTFGTLLKKLRVRRDPARTPLVSVLFNLDQALDQESTAFPGLSMAFDSTPRSSETFELFVNAVQVNGELRLECQYNRDLFDADTVLRWVRSFETLLRAAVEQDATAFCRLPLVDATAQAELASQQPASTPYDGQMRAHEFFEAQADRTPQRIAVRAGTQTLTYAELETRSNRIAQLLRARGLRRGALVGLALDRDADMVAAVLGVLKSGAGYVPLDPAFPDERLAYMVGDAGLAALLTQGEHAERFDLRGRPVLVLDALADELDVAASTRLGRDEDSALPESIAFVIYTSGSTGRPKGVQVPHRTTANFIPAMQVAPGIAADDRLVSVTTLSFDIAFMELMLPLSVGAEVMVATREQQRDGAALRALLESSQASYLQSTPSGWRLLVESGWQGRPGFKAVSGGEPLALDLAEALLARCGEVWNGYGPTETTVYSTYWRVQDPRLGIGIGRPIANTQVWILDEHQQPCPFGVPGELWIGGDGVTLGYLGRPELTAERFVDDPYSKTPGARLYRTGDRARWRPDGNLEHLGRLDYQVKIRGYRIELGEIEASLAAREEIARVLVIVREDRPNDQRLVAYVVNQPGARFDESVLRAHLRDVLPAYMVPQNFVPLDELPLLPNGKVDRSALPSPTPIPAAADVRTTTAEANAILDPRVRYLADIWTELLGTQAGAEDNFFDLGGHSMLAVQMANRVARDTGVRIKLVRLGAETLAQVAADLPVVAAAETSVVGGGGRFSQGLRRLFGLVAMEPRP